MIATTTLRIEYDTNCAYDKSSTAQLQLKAVFRGAAIRINCSVVAGRFSMFHEACNQYLPTLCSFGGGDTQTKGRLHAHCCLLSPTHVLTAAHCVEMATTTYSYPVVSKHDGLFRCELLYSHPTLDVAILETTANLATTDRTAPRTYPNYLPVELNFGMQIGYITWLRKRDSSGDFKMYQYFGCGYTAFLGPSSDNTPRWVLSNGLIESGFSGSPAFTADGQLVGVVTGASRMAAEIDGVPSLPVQYPQISPLPALSNDLMQAIAFAKT